MKSSEAVLLLQSKFPQLSEDAKEKLNLDEPYYAYGLLASELEKRKDELPFFEAVCRFIDEVAESDDPLLRDILITCLLERVADDLELVSKVRARIGPLAVDLLDCVERDMFGRQR